MKKILLILISACLMVACASPASSFSSKLDKMEENSEKTVTDDEWAQLQQEYEELIRDYNENQDAYTEEEKAEINRIMGRYHGLLVKQGLNDMAREVEKATRHLDSFLEGFFGAFDSEVEEPTQSEKKSDSNSNSSKSQRTPGETI